MDDKLALKRLAGLLAFLCITGPLLWSADYVGSSACAPCHSSEFQKQSGSHHAKALRPLDGSLLGRTLLQNGRSPDGKLQYTPDAKGIVVHEKDSPEVVRLEWAFGAGVQGSTAVGHLGDQYIEHRFSFYSRIQGLAPTFGHPPKVSTPIAEMGVLQDTRTIYQCFNCHATGVQKTADGPDLSSAFLGVQCERCHGPGSSHIQAAEQHLSNTEVRQRIVNPGRLPPKAQIEICGQCHRLPGPDTGEAPELENPVTVRFAPIGLLASQCFRVSQAISCLTCHDPHSDVQSRTDLSYTTKCLTCHANDHRPINLCRRKEKQNCLPCHMPQSSLGAYLRFTDHRIRVEP